MTVPRRFSGAVLTGGASRRMGTDKAFVVVDGRPMAVIALDALLGGGADEVLAVGGDRTRLEAVGFTYVTDTHPGEGPLGALIEALTAARHDLVVVLACDLPWITADAVARLVAALAADRTLHVALFETDGHRHVLTAAYDRRILPFLETSFHTGERAVQRPLQALRVKALRPADPRWVTNVNHPDQLPG